MTETTPKHHNGLQVWNKEIPGAKIPGSTRVPIAEIINFFEGKMNGRVGLDLGSGKGRSSEQLQNIFTTSRIVALDLSLEGLQLTNIQNKLQASAEHLPNPGEVFDFINVCGVMTNLVKELPEDSIILREKVVSELFRVTKKGGCVVISDFSANHDIDGYNVNYHRHALITEEIGTIAVLKTGETFIGKTNDEISNMKGTNLVERYAHHYTPQELIQLVIGAGFTVQSYTVELGKTPSGNNIENIILVAKK